MVNDHDFWKGTSQLSFGETLEGGKLPSLSELSQVNNYEGISGPLSLNTRTSIRPCRWLKLVWLECRA